MLKEKKKFSRKEIKQDKLVTLYYKAIGWLDTYKNYVYMGIGAVVVIVLAIFYFNAQSAEKNEKASVELARMMEIYDGGNYLEAVDGRPNSQFIGLKQIVSSYSGSEMGEIARIYLANSYYFLEKYDEALKEYESFSGKNEMMKAAAIAGQASCYEQKSEWVKSAELYEKAGRVSKINVLTPKYFVSAAINYIDANELKKAGELLEAVKKDYPKSPFAREVDRYLVLTEEE